MRKFIPIALILGFFLIGLNVFLKSKPSSKNPRIYKFVQRYSPYYLKKTFGGLEILSKKDKNFKLNPDNAELYHRFEKLEYKWGKGHLAIEGKNLIIKDNNASTIGSIILKTNKEIKFVHKYYGL